MVICHKTNLNQQYVSGVLITGGASSAAGNTAELYLPSSGVSCTLPSLPNRRESHTVSKGGLLCGGGYTHHKRFTAEDSCLKWSPDSGTWEEALTLDVFRRLHVSWTPSSGNNGTYLMGGDYHDYNYHCRNCLPKSTTLIKNDGSQEPGFPLKYDAL